MIKEILRSQENKMQKALEALQNEFSRIRSGRANPGLLENVKVLSYNSEMPLKQLASVSVEDARTLLISPWDKSTVAQIEKAILNSGLGLNPVTAGMSIRVPLPALTEERRRDMVKIVKKIAEDARISIRNTRKDAKDSAKTLLKNKEISEDEHKDGEAEIQELTDKYIKQVDDLFASKEKDLMSV